jgi:D-glycero-beta-D-manno-heptose-7-phosphate kinase
MNHIDSSRAEQILNNANGKRIAVVGDYMLDRHFKGSVKRISPEAPVPVVEVETETTGLGGAGNVVQNLASLGAIPYAFGLTGKDSSGEVLISMLQSYGAPTGGMLSAPNRKTTEKMRIIAHDQHVVRVDRETVESLSKDEEDKLLSSFSAICSSLHSVILQDYNKGVLTQRVIEGVIETARKHKVAVSVDPKFNNFFSYKQVHLFKPNIKEMELALGVRIQDEEQFIEAGKLLFDRLAPEYLLVTRGEKGMTLFHGREHIQTISTRAIKVHDVSGAGDTVISTFMVAEAGGATPAEAAVLANYAAGVVCGEVGVVPIERQRLIDIIAERS